MTQKDKASYAYSPPCMMQSVAEAYIYVPQLQGIGRGGIILCVVVGCSRRVQDAAESGCRDVWCQCMAEAYIPQCQGVGCGDVILCVVLGCKMWHRQGVGMCSVRLRQKHIYRSVKVQGVGKLYCVQSQGVGCGIVRVQEYVVLRCRIWQKHVYHSVRVQDLGKSYCNSVRVQGVAELGCRDVTCQVGGCDRIIYTLVIGCRARGNHTLHILLRCRVRLKKVMFECRVGKQ